MNESSISTALDINQCLEDILSILATLDGRVKRLELKLNIKRRKSYLKPSEEECPVTVENALKTMLELNARLTILESQI